jgi:hypothetical protein
METKRSARGWTTVAAGLQAFGGLMTTGVAIADADTIQTEGSYPSREACQDAGPGANTPDRAAAGSWRLVMSN